LDHPLTGAWSKIARAEMHAKCLRAKIAATPEDAKAVSFAQHFDPDTKTIKIVVDTVPVFPVQWSLIAADSLQACRVALNYLAWELAKWNLQRQNISREPANKTEFPIATTAGNFPAYKVADLFSDHVAQIEKLQPYDADYVALDPWAPTKEWVRKLHVANHPLAILQKLTNTDKHRSLQLLAVAPEITLWKGGRGINCKVVSRHMRAIAGALKPGAEWSCFDVIPTDPDPKVEVEDRFAPQIAFEHGWGVEEVLNGSREHASAILREFKPVFV
jgi:hypothetical protein